MTQHEWLIGTDPAALLVEVLGGCSQRKLRLFVCACARQLWERFRDPRSRRAVEVGERFADDQASEDERQAAWTAALEAQADATWDATLEAQAAAWTVRADVTEVAARVIGYVARLWARRVALGVACKGLSGEAVREARAAADLVARARQCYLLRDVFGNPFRLPAADPRWLNWHGGTVRHIARAIYQERRFDEMPVLADALDDAGCDDAIVLDHCRNGGTHVRGCHVLDLLLGKE